jgi:hypothetical protein
MVQMMCGWVALVTSARTYEGDPCMTSRASCAVGWPVQVADMLAQVGTCEPVGEGVGASADGDAVRAAEAVGDVWTAAVLVVPQAAATVRAASASSPTLRLTRCSNGAPWMQVTDRPRDTGATE